MRARFESVIGLAAPFLDLVLAVGDRVSRVAGAEDDYIPIRAAAERVGLGAGTRPAVEAPDVRRSEAKPRCAAVEAPDVEAPK